MSLEKLLQEIREHYLKQYREAIARYIEIHTPATPEVCIEPHGDSDSDWDLVYRLFRVDLIGGSKEQLKLADVGLDTFLNFAPQEYSASGSTVLVSPIYWNGVEFRVSPSIDNDEEIKEWALGWIDLDETAPIDEHGLGNYVHSITKPEIVGSTTVFSIDFGSAEITAVIELIDILIGEGAASIEIHSESMIDVEKDDSE